MSLIDLRWAWVAGAALGAIFIPVAVLQQPQSDRSGAALPPTLTKFEAPDQVSLSLALSAPLFSPSRTVPDPVEIVASADSTAPVAQTAPPPTLVGIVGRARGKSIALIKKNDGTTVTVSPGEVVDGWQVGKIGRDRVSLSMNGEHREAALGFPNKPPPGNGPPPTQLPSSTSPQQTEAQPQTPGTSS